VLGRDGVTTDAVKNDLNECVPVFSLKVSGMQIAFSQRSIILSSVASMAVP